MLYALVSGPLIVVEDSEHVECLTTPMKTPDRPLKKFVTTKKKNPLGETNINVTPITPFARPVARLKIFSSGEENTPPFSPPKTKTRRKALPKSVKETSPILKTPTYSSPKTKLKRKSFPKFVIQTPSYQKPSKTSQKPFTIYNDEEFSAPYTITSKSKPTERKQPKAKKTVTQSKVESKKSTKETLSPSVNSILGKKPDVKVKTEIIPVDDEIIRKSKRTNTLARKTYGKSKIPLKKECQIGEISQVKEENKKRGEDVFLLDKMQLAISNVEESAQSKNANSTKFSSSLSLPKKPSLADLCSSFSELDTKDNKGSFKISDSKDDCDLVEGTPPDPPKKTFTLRSKKARSNKV